MPTYVMLSTLTPEGVQTVKNNPQRISEVNKEVEQLGATVKAQWATLGHVDFISVVEAPDEGTMARVSLELGSRGTAATRRSRRSPSMTSSRLCKVPAIFAARADRRPTGQEGEARRRARHIARAQADGGVRGQAQLDDIDVDAPRVGIVMGSKSDMETMEKAAKELEERGILHEMRVMSAHREPDLVAEYAKNARMRGLRVIIAGAGISAALPGAVAAHTDLPVIGVPLSGRLTAAGGLDAILSIVQMPPGVPVACVGLDNPRNAAILAAQILGMPPRAGGDNQQ